MLLVISATVFKCTSMCFESLITSNISMLFVELWEYSSCVTNLFISLCDSPLIMEQGDNASEEIPSPVLKLATCHQILKNSDVK